MHSRPKNFLLITGDDPTDLQVPNDEHAPVVTSSKEQKRAAISPCAISEFGL